MENYKIKDINLAEQGKGKIYWAETRMPVLMKIKERFEQEKPLEGITVGLCLHITKETAVLMKTLKAGGANISIAPCNPLSTQDDVAAALASEGFHVYGWYDETNDEYYANINRVLDHKPEITVDDACDLIFTVHTSRQELIENIKGGCEETTSGVQRLRAMEKEGALKYPVLAINDADTKHLFDNRYGTGQSSLDGIMRATSILLAGKALVVGGYGWCARGVAMRAKGMGANVIITEINPVKALEATMDGFKVMTMLQASEIGDIFITATGSKGIIRKEHMEKMKDGAVICNTGHFDNEIKKADLESLTESKKKLRPNTVEYKLKNGNKVYLLAEGRLINLASAEGHPSEVMDMSFANQVLGVEYIAKNHEKLVPKVYDIPEGQDEMIARLKLDSMGISIDKQTEEQIKYLAGWREGTE